MRDFLEEQVKGYKVEADTYSSGNENLARDEADTQGLKSNSSEINCISRLLFCLQSISFAKSRNTPAPFYPNIRIYSP